MDTRHNNDYVHAMHTKQFLTYCLFIGLLPASGLSQPVIPVPVATGLNQPLAIEHAGDGSEDLYIVEQAGRILRYRDGLPQGQPFLDIRDQVGCCMERGLLGLAFHPDYANNGEFFVNYTDNNFDTVIARYRSDNGTTTDTGTEEILLTIDQPFSNHNGGHLVFGPDGFLYAGTGDGGSGGDPQNNAQDGQSLLGKMLRIDVDSGNPYGIPGDNPFVGSGDARDEIWATGLRNPFRYSFDAVTGDLYIADVGQDQVEEVHVHRANTPAGENFGWRRMEGSRCFNPSTNCNDDSLTLPAFEYMHGQGRCSITGGYVYRGSAVPGLVGAYVFGDFCSGEIMRADYANGNWTQTVMLDTGFSISSFGQDAGGELYVADLGGAVYKLVKPLQVSPASGSYLTSQRIDLSFVLRKPGVDVTSLDVRLDGVDISAPVNNCLREGQLEVGGESYRCPGIPLSLLSAGSHHLSVTAGLSDGSSVADSVRWEILQTSED